VFRTIVQSYREAFSGLPRSVWLLATAQFVNRSGTMVLPFLTLWLIEERGFSPVTAGRALGLYGIGAMIGAIAGGYLVDILSPRRVMILSLLGAGAGFIILGRIESRHGLLGMLFALSLVAEALRPAASTALARSAAPGERVRAYALNRLAVNLGMTFGPTVGGFLAMRSYDWLFLVDGATCLLAAGLLRTFYRDEPRPREAGSAAAGIEAPRTPWRDGPLLVFLGLFTLYIVVLFQVFSTYPLYIHRDLGHSEGLLGILLGTNTLVIVAVEMVIVHRLRNVPPLKLIGPGCFLFCAGLALMPLGSGFAWLLFTVLVWTAGEMLALPFVETIVADRADERSRGRYLGMLTVSFALALVIAPVAGTWVYGHAGPAALWFGCGGVGAVLCLGFRALGERLGEPKGPAESAAGD